MSPPPSPDPRPSIAPRHSIPLDDLPHPIIDDDAAAHGGDNREHARGRHLLHRTSSATRSGTRYSRLSDSSPSPATRVLLPASQHFPAEEEPAFSPPSPMEENAPMSTPMVGLNMPHGTSWPGEHSRRNSYPPLESRLEEEISPYENPFEDPANDDDSPGIGGSDADDVGLTDPNYLAPISGASNPSTPRQSSERMSFQSIRFDSPQSGRSMHSNLGDSTASGGRRRSRSFGTNLRPDSAKSSLNASPISKAGSIMRAVSQRVVNVSNDGVLPEPTHRAKESVDEEAPPLSAGLPPIHVTDEEAGHPSQDPFNQDPFSSPVEKQLEPPHVVEPQAPPAPPWPITNPLRGKSLGIFAPDNYIRMKLCEVLVSPLTEPIILILIVTQTVLVSIHSSDQGYDNPHASKWKATAYYFVLLALFIVYTMELTAKIIVSGFFFNAEEYSSKANAQQDLKSTIVTKYRKYFKPQRKQSVNTNRRPDAPPISAAISRTLTSAIKTPEAYPTTFKEQQRYQLARRAFFRHSLNRIDFVAVVAFWISLGLGASHVEAQKHIYVFRMISCLRVLRLLWLTNGTAIILKSLKKAAPLLVNVAFLIGFFWLLFAIVGIQVFKSSFSRSCVWIDPQGLSNYSDPETLCGGHLDVKTGVGLPWVYENGTAGAASSKGYLCPRGSLCMEGQSMYNGTVNFDNVINSLELVFVIMSANTFSDLMYYTMDSDYLAAALFFAGGLIIMMLWLTNLLIAVITSSFQVIREESKRSAFAALPEATIAPPAEEPGSRATTIRIAYDRTFWLWILIIILGLAAQATKSSTMSEKRARFVLVAEVIVTFALDAEILFRIASDFRRFHKNWRNGFDTFLAIITTVILLPPIRNSGQPYAWLSIFQLLRFYRVVWAVPMTRNLIAKVLGNVTGILNLFLFVALITYLMAILAVQLFRGVIPAEDDDGNVHTTFFSLWNAFLAMYQILSSENWTEILYNVTSYSDSYHTAWVGAVFLVAWFVLSYFILLNMFIAVIQENFDVSEDEKRLEQVKALLQRKELNNASSNLTLSTIFRFGRSKKVRDPLDFGQSTLEMLLKDAVVRDFLDDEYDTAPAAVQLSPTFQDVPDGSRWFSGWWKKIVARVWHREPNPFYSRVYFTGSNDARDPKVMAKEVVAATATRKRAQREYLQRHPNYNRSLFIFKPRNRIRRLCQKIVGPGRGADRIEGVEPSKIVWYSFSALIYAAIVTMVVLACVSTPLYQRDYAAAHQMGNWWFIWTDLVFAVFFTTEALIKVIADGCFSTPNAYFRSLWGFIDGVVLITLWINVITSFENDGAISRAVGAFKALRALRLLHISDSARETFHSVILVGGWRVLSAAFVSMSLLIPFAIYGLNIFQGQFATCNDSDAPITNLTDCYGEYNSTPFSSDWPFPAPRLASNPYYNFDDFGSSLFILYQIVSEEGWIDVLWSAQSITGKGMQPEDFASQGNAVFFVVFNIMATVFVLTLFISVFMRTYTEQTGVAFLTAEQRSWMELQKLLRRVAPSKRPVDEIQSSVKEWCYKKAVQKHCAWSRTITVTLVFHLILLMTEFYPEPYWWTRTRDSFFLLFTVIYTANIIIRIVGLSWPRFRRSTWDMYSLVSVAGTIVTTILQLASYGNPSYQQAHKLFLVSIALLLIPRNNALDQLFKTAAASLTSILNLLATWIILYLVYALAMTQTFGLTRFGSQGTNNLNFRDVPRAMILLFRMSYGEGWNEIMEDYAKIVPPLCTNGHSFYESDCGSAEWARTLFISWNILSMYIFVSLFVSLIYESFSYVYQRSSGYNINRDETRRFKQAWAIFDPDGTGYVSKEDFPRLLGELSGIFSMRIHDADDSVHQILEDAKASDSDPRGSSAATASASAGIDLQKLNARLAQIDTKKIRERRDRYKIFYEEVMVSAVPGHGISFTSLLMILAHYNIINDSKSLKLDEFLRRRARLQRVEEEVRRRIVVGFFDTLFWSRRFRRHQVRQSLSLMTQADQRDVPEIVVEHNDVDSDEVDGRRKTLSSRGSGSGANSEEGDSEDRWGRRATVDLSEGHGSFRELFGLSSRRGSSVHSRQESSAHSRQASSAHSRRSSKAGSAPGSPVRSLAVSGVGTGVDWSETIPEPRGGGHSPHSSSDMRDMAVEAFNDSAWGESLRKSFTVRRSGSSGRRRES